MKQIVIVGGGITGLSAAYYLEKLLGKHSFQAHIRLIEANKTLGGKIHTIHDNGFTMEAGADSIVARKPNVAPLLAELGLEDKVVYNSTGRSFLYIDNELKRIPEDSHFGIPLSFESLVSSELISAQGKVEALKDFYTPNQSFTKNDSIGRFLSNFLGEEIVKRQIAPVLSGVYSGNIDELTIASTLPYVLDYKNEYGSILKGFFENRSKYQSSDGKKFISFKRGAQHLINKMESMLKQTEVLKGNGVKRIERKHDRYTLTLAGGQKIEADEIILSTPHDVSQKMLDADVLQESFEQLTNSSLISVYAGFNLPDRDLPADGTGFIVANDSDLQCNACTWMSRKWEHTTQSGELLVRLFYKSSKPGFQALQQASDEELLQAALEDIRLSLGIDEKPTTFSVNKWINAMPTYHIRHNEIVETLEEQMEMHFPGVHLAGCSYYGVGIPDCAASGEQAAQRIIQQWEAR